jgi:2-polyprenyl-3-methyl-5-hydroxy-6-metoxy-1,4-benzoquinol methylase
MSDAARRIPYRRFREVYDAVILGADFLEEHAYYEHYRERYWRTLGYIEPLLTQPHARVLDIGSGQFALLCRHLFDARCDVADIDSRHVEVLRRSGIGFQQVDLFRGAPVGREAYDLVVLAEVIEHVPRPPYLVFGELRACLRPGGRLLVTTPNLYRLRNVVRLALGRRVFDPFLVPEKDRPLGHFLEYDLGQLTWHMREAGFEVERATIDQLDHGGMSTGARLARQMLRPLLALRPLWQDNLVLVGRRPIEQGASPSSHLAASSTGDSASGIC